MSLLATLPKIVITIAQRKYFKLVPTHLQTISYLVPKIDDAIIAFSSKWEVCYKGLSWRNFAVCAKFIFSTIRDRLFLDLTFCGESFGPPPKNDHKIYLIQIFYTWSSSSSKQWHPVRPNWTVAWWYHHRNLMTSSSLFLYNGSFQKYNLHGTDVIKK